MNYVEIEDSEITKSNIGEFLGSKPLKYYITKVFFVICFIIVCYFFYKKVNEYRRRFKRKDE